MAAADWDRTNGSSFVTIDDTATDNIFGENCLDMPGSTLGNIWVDTAVSQADMVVDVDFYWKGNTTVGELLLGARINASTGDGYYAGYFGPSTNVNPAIIKRVSGVNTEIAFFANLSNLKLDLTVGRLVFRVSGTELTLYTVESGQPHAVVQVNDSTFAGAGSAGILRTLSSNSAMRLDNFIVRDL